MIEIRQAAIGDLELVVPLFDAYREFYRQQSDPERARRFLRDRLSHKESIIFLAFLDSSAIGFTQLYPSFSSAAMARIFIVNDLFLKGITDDQMRHQPKDGLNSMAWYLWHTSRWQDYAKGLRRIG